MFTSYKLPNVGAGLTVGGGVRWQSMIYNNGSGPDGARFEQGAYAVADLMLPYALTRHLEATLNVNSVCDRSDGTDARSSYAGVPRSVLLGLRRRI